MTRVDPSADDRWAAYVSDHPDGSAFHAPGWLAALREESGTAIVGLACEDEHGSLRGVLPLMTTRGLPVNIGAQHTGRRLSSLPRTPMAGPLADSDAAQARLLGAAIELAARVPGRLLQIKSYQEGLERGVDGLVAVPWRPGFVIELPAPPDRPRFGDSRNHSRIRWAVNKATREGVQVREASSEEDLRAWYRLYLETMRHHAVPPRSYGLFASLWRRRQPGGMRLLLAELVAPPRARLLAGSVFLAAARTVSYAFNGSHRQDLGLRPNDAILWQAIHDAWEQGYRQFDLGEVVGTQGGLAEFKSKWGAREVRLWRYYHPAPARVVDAGLADDHESAALRTARSAWRRLPLPLTAYVGGWVYRWL